MTRSLLLLTAPLCAAAFPRASPALLRFEVPS